MSINNRYLVLVLKTNVHKQGHFNKPFIMRGNHFLIQGHKKDLPQITCIFLSYLIHVCSKKNLVSAILHHFSLLRLLPKSYFKISTFQPNFLCSSSFKIGSSKHIQTRRVRSETKKACLAPYVTGFPQRWEIEIPWLFPDFSLTKTIFPWPVTV